MASYVLNGHTYSLSVLSGTNGRAYAQAEPFTGSGATLWDMFFTDLFGQIATAITGNGISPGTQYSTVRSNGTNWVRVAGVTPSTDFNAALSVAKGGTGLSALGTALQYLRTNSGATAMEWGSAAVPSFALLHGGTADTLPNGAWTKRTLNTEAYDPDGIVSLAASVFTLIAGTYIVLAETTGSADSGYTSDNRLRLRNTTDSTTEYTGQQYRSKNKGTPEVSAACITMQAQFVIAASKAFELQQEAGSAPVIGGISSGSAETQKYATMLIMKIS